MENRKIRIIIYSLLVLYFSFFFSRKINLITADLGRHITNGKVFLEKGIVVSTNYYSYTQPDFSVVTHHWLSGVVFYLVHNLTGFNGLSFFYIIVSGLTVFFFFKVAEEKSSIYVALLSSLLLIPLMASRKEIRPEGFSYLLMGIYYYLLTIFLKKKIEFKFLVPVILVLQVLWINLHLFFIIGIMIIGAFTFVEFIKQFVLRRKSHFKQFLILLVSATLVSLLNPYFIQGLLEPLNILKEYGYMIIENQTVFFMQKRRPSFDYFYFKLLSVVFLYIGVHITISKRRVAYAVPVLLSLAFAILGYRAIRGIPIFALFMVPLVALYVFEYLKMEKSDLFKWAVGAFILLSFIPGHYFSISDEGSGLGLAPEINLSAEFAKDNNLKGPIFNNYDIGGYLIYHFYEKEPVFVDNRPEAYSVSFFNKIYGPMQEKEDKWEEALEEYDFNTIYFYRRDATQYAQPFLIDRIQDDEWIPVHVDTYVLILVRNNEQNKDIISNHQLPKEMFVAR